MTLSDAKHDAPRTYDNPEAYVVYSTLIPKQPGWVYGNSRSLVISASTVSDAMCLKPDDNSVGAVGPAIASYGELVRKRWLLVRRFGFCKPYTLVDDREFGAYFSKNGSGWNGFYAKYLESGGYISLSPVGFNSARDVAVVEINHVCGWLCGEGSFAVLQKRNGEWKDFGWSGSPCHWVS